MDGQMQIPVYNPYLRSLNDSYRNSIRSPSIIHSFRSLDPCLVFRYSTPASIHLSMVHQHECKWHRVRQSAIFIQIQFVVVSNLLLQTFNVLLLPICSGGWLVQLIVQQGVLQNVCGWHDIVPLAVDPLLYECLGSDFSTLFGDGYRSPIGNALYRSLNAIKSNTTNSVNILTTVSTPAPSSGLKFFLYSAVVCGPASLDDLQSCCFSVAPK